MPTISSRIHTSAFLFILIWVGFFAFPGSAFATSLTASKITINGLENQYLQAGRNTVRVYFNSFDIVADSLTASEAGYGFDPQGEYFGYVYNDINNESNSTFNITPDPTNSSIRSDFQETGDGTTYLEFIIELPFSQSELSGLNGHIFHAKDIDGMGDLIIKGVQTSSGVVGFNFPIYAYTRDIDNDSSNRRLLKGSIWSSQIGYCQLDHGVEGYLAQISYKGKDRGNLYGHIFCPNVGWINLEHPNLVDYNGNPISMVFIDPISANDIREDGQVAGFNDPITVTEVLQIRDYLYGEAFSPIMGFIQFKPAKGYSTVDVQSATGGIPSGASLVSNYSTAENNNPFGWFYFDHGVTNYIASSFDITSPKVKDSIQISYEAVDGTTTKVEDNGVIEVSRNCAFVNNSLLTKYPECDEDKDGYADGARLELIVKTTFPEQNNNVELVLESGSLGCNIPTGCPLLDQNQNEVLLWNNLDLNRDSMEDINPEQAQFINLLAIDNDVNGGTTHKKEVMLINHRSKIRVGKRTSNENGGIGFQNEKQEPGIQASTVSNVLVIQNQAKPTTSSLVLGFPEQPILGAYSNTIPLKHKTSSDLIIHYQAPKNSRYLQGELIFNTKVGDYFYYQPIGGESLPINTITVITDSINSLEYFDLDNNSWMYAPTSEIASDIWFANIPDRTKVNSVRVKSGDSSFSSVIVTVPGDTTIIGSPDIRFRDATGDIKAVGGIVNVDSVNSTITYYCEDSTCQGNLAIASSVELMIPETKENIYASQLNNSQLIEDGIAIPWQAKFPVQSIGLAVEVENAFIDSWKVTDEFHPDVVLENWENNTFSIKPSGFTFPQVSYFTKNGHTLGAYDDPNHKLSWLFKPDKVNKTRGWYINGCENNPDLPICPSELYRGRIEPQSSIQIEYDTQVNK